MARARNIKPGFFTNDELAEVDPLGRLIFIGLWTIADREGRLEDRPKKIKAEILPYDDCNVDEMLNQLVNNGFILRYKVSGIGYIQIIKFKQHQNPHMKEQPSNIPAPDLHQTSTVQEQNMHGSCPADSLLPITESITESNAYVREEIKPVDNFLSKSSLDQVDDLYPSGNAGEVTPAHTATANQGRGVESSDYSPEFLKFWRVYPKKTKMNLAFEAWNVLIKQGILSVDLTLAAGKYAMHMKADGTAVQFLKSPCNFINEQVYLDYLPQNVMECPKCKGQGWYVDQVPTSWGGTKEGTIHCDCRTKGKAI